MSYRTKEEVDEWAELDPLKVFPKQIIDAKVATKKEVEAVKRRNHRPQPQNVRARFAILRLLLTPIMRRIPDHIESVMFSNAVRSRRWTTVECDVRQKKEENERVKKIAKAARYAYDKDGKPPAQGQEFTVSVTVFSRPLWINIYTDPTLIAYGEDVRDWNGAFAVYRGLTEALPYHRLFNSPIAESAIVGSAVGYGMAGGRVIAELMYC